MWLSHSNRNRDKIPHSPTPGTSYKQQVETSLEKMGNRKRKGESNDELQHPSTLRLDTKIPRPVKRSRFLTCEYVKLTTTSSRNASPLTTHETEKSALTDVPLSPVARVTHGSHPRSAGTHDGGSPTDASPSQPDTKKCIQVGRETYAVTSQPGTSYSSPDYDSILVIDSSSPSVPVHSPPTVGTSSGPSATVQTAERRERKRKKAGHTNRTYTIIKG